MVSKEKSRILDELGTCRFDEYSATSNTELLEYLHRGVRGDKSLSDRECKFVELLLSSRQSEAALKLARALNFLTFALVVVTAVLTYVTANTGATMGEAVIVDPGN